MCRAPLASCQNRHTAVVNPLQDSLLPNRCPNGRHVRSGNWHFQAHRGSGLVAKFSQVDHRIALAQDEQRFGRLAAGGPRPDERKKQNLVRIDFYRQQTNRFLAGIGKGPLA